jgi:hypothetical protein
MDVLTRTVKLPSRLSGSGGFLFVHAIVFDEPRLPFAIVKYSVAGREEKLGLRLDLDKQVFLDHFEDSIDEKAAREAAPQIVTFLAEGVAGVQSATSGGRS